MSPRLGIDGRAGVLNRQSARIAVGRSPRRSGAKARSKPSSRSRPTVRSRPSTVMSISAPASAPRSDRSSPKNSTCPLRASSSCSAIPRAVPNQGATIASETIQIIGGAAAQGRGAGAAIPARARRGTARTADRGSCDRRRPDPRARQPQRQLRRIDCAARPSALNWPTTSRSRRSAAYTHRRAIGAARRSSGQGDRRTGLCSRRARARHAARPRRAPALCRRRCRRLCRHQPDRGRRSLGARYSGAGRRRQDRRFRRRHRRARGKRGQGGRATQGDLEADADAARSEGRRDRAARQSIDAADPDRQGRCRRRDRRRRKADAADLYLAVPDARLDRPVLRGRGLSGRPDPGVVRHAKSAHPARRSRAAAASGRKPKSM